MRKINFVLLFSISFMFYGCNRLDRLERDMAFQSELLEKTLLDVFLRSNDSDSIRQIVIIDSVLSYGGYACDNSEYINDSIELESLSRNNAELMGVRYKISNEYLKRPNYIIISKDSIQNILNTGKSYEGWRLFSKTFPHSFGAYIKFYAFRVSQSGRYAVGSYDVICGGLCGGGSDLVFENINGSWTLIHHVQRWIS